MRQPTLRLCLRLGGLVLAASCSSESGQTADSARSWTAVPPVAQEEPHVAAAPVGSNEHDAQATVPAYRATRSWSVTSEQFATPRWVVRSGGFLWVGDFSQSHNFHILDPGSGKVLQSFGETNDGAGRSPRLGMFVRGDTVVGSIVALHADPSLYSLNTLTPTCHAEGGCSIREAVHEVGKFVRYVSALGANNVIGFNRREENAFHFFDKQGNYIRSADLDYGLPDNVLPYQKRRAMNGSLTCGREDGRGFALTFRYAGRIALFDSLGAPIGDARVPFPEAAVFDRDPVDGALKHYPAKEHYLMCAYAGGKLLALYSGALLGQSATTSGSVIHVFGSAGQLEAVLDLPEPANAFYADSQLNALFVTTLGAAVQRLAVAVDVFRH